MTLEEAVRQIAVGVGAVLVVFVVSVVIVNMLYRVDGVGRLVVIRVRCLRGRHGWITVTFSDLARGHREPRSMYRVCATCRRREDL